MMNGGLFVFPWLWGMFLMVATGDPAFFTDLMVFCVLLDFLKSNASDGSNTDDGKAPTASVDKTKAGNLATGLTFPPEEISAVPDDSEDDAKPDTLPDDRIPEAKQDAGSLPKAVGSPAVKQPRRRPARYPIVEWTGVEYFKVHEGRDHLKVRKVYPVEQRLPHAQHQDTEPAVEQLCDAPAEQLDATTEPAAPKNFSAKLSGLKRRGVKLLQRMRIRGLLKLRGLKRGDTVPLL